MQKIWTEDEIRKEVRKVEGHKGEWKLEDIPFYEPGVPRIDLWHKVEYLDTYDLLWGKKWGHNGIGKLREVAVCRPTEFERVKLFEKDPAHFFYYGEMPDIDKFQRQHDNMVQILKDQGVIVHYLPENRFPVDKCGPFGPLRYMWCPGEVLVIRGGGIVPKFGWATTSMGREVVTTRWLVEQGCPILLTICGKGVNEPGASFFLADDCYVTALSIAYNQEGLDQMIPVLNRTGTTEILILKMPGPLKATSWPACATYHPDMVMGPLDIGKVILYPALVDFESVKWLKDRGFEIIEIDADEQRDEGPANLVILEPGKVMMPAGAKKTISNVRKAGVEVIDVDISEFNKTGGGMHCATMPLVRDPGPKLEDM